MKVTLMIWRCLNWNYRILELAKSQQWAEYLYTLFFPARHCEVLPVPKQVRERQYLNDDCRDAA
jgi:hypothetical protein|nr:hypothetical protein [Mucilaginibacter sp. X4EP1]